MLTITPAAAERLKVAVLEEGEFGDGMRISVVGGGASGLQYGFDFDKRKVGDHVLSPLAGLEVYVDDESMRTMGDVTLDHAEGRGFRFRRG